LLTFATKGGNIYTTREIIKKMLPKP